MTIMNSRDERPYVFCCNSSVPAICDCVNKNHGTAFFDKPPARQEGDEDLKRRIDSLSDDAKDWLDQTCHRFADDQGYYKSPKAIAECLSAGLIDKRRRRIEVSGEVMNLVYSEGYLKRQEGETSEIKTAEDAVEALASWFSPETLADVLTHNQELSEASQINNLAIFAAKKEKELSAKQAEVERLRSAMKSNENGITFEDYEEVLESHRALVREIDGIMFGENAAKQASLCDLVHPIRKMKSELESLKAAQEWRPISGSLPNVGEEVLGTCFIEGDWTFPVIGTYKGRKTQGEAIALETDDDDFHPCSHWMPLPTPPVERIENKG